MKLSELEISSYYKRITEQDDNDNGQYERLISIPTTSISKLRGELYKTIGEERTKGFLLRYGWHAGAEDAKKILKSSLDKMEDIIRAGPRTHIFHGWVEDIDLLDFKVDKENRKLYLEAIWKKSYESQEFIDNFGESKCSVCHTLTGYASGYLSTAVGAQVIVIEKKCEAKGDDYCHCVCRTVDEWGEEVKDELKYFEADSIIKELNVTYDALRQERDNLKKAFNVHKVLMKEINSGNNTSSIIKMLHRITGRPAMLIENYHRKIISSKGLNETMIDVDNIFKSKNVIQGTKLLQMEGYQILITPVYVQKELTGYCGLIFDTSTIPTDLDYMILERGALVCSTILLNEKISLDTQQKVGGSLLEEMLAGRISNEEIYRRAFYLGCEQLTPYFVVVMDVLTPTSAEQLEVNEKITKEINYYFKNSREANTVLIMQQSGKVIFLCAEDETLKSKVQKERMIRELITYCQQPFGNLKFRLGISTVSDRIEDISNIYSESIAALKVTNPKRPIAHFKTLGIEGLLFQLEDEDIIDKLIEKKLGKLLEEDKDFELTKTLFYYLRNGCNLHQTAREMNFSISGLRYRINQINEIIEEKVSSPETSYQLFFALKALALLGEIDIDVEMGIADQ